MKTKYFRLTLIPLLIIYLNNILLVDNIVPGNAQSSQNWSEAINISNSGSSKDPSIVTDLDGVIHIIWVDEFDGYKYVQSSDGINWTPSKAVDFPFKPDGDSEPKFSVTQDGIINIFWQDSNNKLYFSQTQPLNFDKPSNWAQIQVLADSALDFDITTDDRGLLHLSYVKKTGGNTNPAGVYYRRRDTTGWSPPVSLYTSKYFRSIFSGDAHVRVASSIAQDGVGSVYVVWDDRLQKRIFLARSLDAGLTWESPSQIRGPKDSTGIEFPFNINLAVNEDKALLIWQIGIPGGQCDQYSQQSIDGGNSFGEPIRVLDEFIACPQQIEPILQDKDFLVFSIIAQNELSLIAWDGFGWSNVQPQTYLSTLINPETLDSIFIGCQKQFQYKEIIYFVGCDQGNGEDIWFSSRPLGSLDDWFPLPTAWTIPVKLTSVNNKLSGLTLVADDKDTTHAFWVQSSLADQDEDSSTIQYSQWNGSGWSNPVSIIAKLSEKPIQLAFDADSVGRLLLAWVGEQSRELSFQWAGSEQAGRASEWVDPINIYTSSQLNSSPDIVTDASGTILIGYAIPINEQRGLYFVKSVDAGQTWLQPLQIFDAVAADWDMVDQPRMCLSGDGRIHVLFGKYSFQGNLSQSLGLYYSQSTNGGATWSESELVSDQPVVWSEILSFGQLDIHRLWQEKRQSSFISLHQYSQDRGLTWSRPQIISNSIGINVLNDAVIDQFGNVHFFQLDGEDKPSISHYEWDGMGWIDQAPNSLETYNRGKPTSLAADIDSSGRLLLSFVVEYQNVDGSLTSDIFGMVRSLDETESIPTPYPVLIPTIRPDVVIDGALENSQTPTPVSSPSDLVDTSPSLALYKNITGILLIGGLLVLIFLVFRPVSRKQDFQDKDDG